jgi:hypothetical protein
VPPSVGVSLAACAPTDESAGAGSDARFVMLRMAGNDKYLAPREQGVVFAAVRRRFWLAGSAPLARLAWRVWPQRNGWVQLQHVLTGRYMRLVTPPDPVQWVVRAELSHRPFGKQSRRDGSTPDKRSGCRCAPVRS